jgi:L-threonylcarbamoyladenylate synthase
MEQQAEIGRDLARAAALLRAGQLVAIPTETVYGLAGNALDAGAVAEIFRVKNRPRFDPLIIHLAQAEQIPEYAAHFPDGARRLAEAFLPGPLSLLLPKRPIVPDLVTAGSPLVAIRVPAHPLTQELLAQLDFPLAAPSANPFGYISPTTPQHVAHQLGDKIPYILDGGPTAVGVESTIVSFAETEPEVLRKGGLAVEEIEAVLGTPVRVRAHSSSNPQAPGMLKSHYAPRVPFRVGDLKELAREHAGQRFGVLAFLRALPQVPADRQRILSPTGDLAEAARNLFAAMRDLDEQDLDLIIAEWLPERGLGRAINDRLRRAEA